ncbi:MAG: peroxiredoxin family protein [Pseudomonadota bacterium]
MKHLMFVLMLMAGPVLAVEIDEVAPDFILKSMTGENLRLEEYRGQVVLVNFWASWCGPCRQEMPVLDRIQDRYEAMGFTVLGVNVDTDETKARKVAERSGVSFPLLLDRGQAVSKQYDVSSMPYTVLVDRDGAIRYIHHGYKPGDENHYIDRLRDLLRASKGAD